MLTGLLFSDAAATEVPSLKKMKNKDILLTLPGTLKVRDINWLSVWCMRFTVNYGEVYIPKDLKIPEKVVSFYSNHIFEKAFQSIAKEKHR